MRRLLTILVSTILLLGASIPLPIIKSVNAKQMEGISNIKNSTPIFLQHSNSIFNQNDNLKQVADHYSHSSHESHASHASHYSSTD